MYRYVQECEVVHMGVLVQVGGVLSRGIDMSIHLHDSRAALLWRFAGQRYITEGFVQPFCGVDELDKMRGCSGVREEV